MKQVSAYRNRPTFNPKSWQGSLAPRIVVTDGGNLCLPSAEIYPAEALALAAWIVETFGPSEDEK